MDSCVESLAKGHFLEGVSLKEPLHYRDADSPMRYPATDADDAALFTDDLRQRVLVHVQSASRVISKQMFDGDVLEKSVSWLTGGEMVHHPDLWRDIRPHLAVALDVFWKLKISRPPFSLRWCFSYSDAEFDWDDAQKPTATTVIGCVVIPSLWDSRGTQRERGLVILRQPPVPLETTPIHRPEHFNPYSDWWWQQ